MDTIALAQLAALFQSSVHLICEWLPAS